MNALVNTVNSGAVRNTKALFEKLCQVNFIDEFWVNIDNPFDNPMKGQCYFTTLRSPANKFTASEFERLLCPMTHSDEEEEVLSTDFWVMQASTDNTSKNFKPIDSVRNDPTFKLLYKDGQGVLFGGIYDLSDEELKRWREQIVDVFKVYLSTKSIYLGYLVLIWVYEYLEAFAVNCTDIQANLGRVKYLWSSTSIQLQTLFKVCSMLVHKPYIDNDSVSKLVPYIKDLDEVLRTAGFDIDIFAGLDFIQPA